MGEENEYITIDKLELYVDLWNNGMVSMASIVDALGMTKIAEMSFPKKWYFIINGEII